MAELVSIILLTAVLFILFYAGIPAKKEEKKGGEFQGRFYAFTPIRNYWGVSLCWDRYPTLKLPKTAVPVDERWKKDTIIDDPNASWWLGPEGYWPSVIGFKWGYKFYYARVWKNGAEWEIDVQEDRVKNAPPKKLKNDDADDFF